MQPSSLCREEYEKKNIFMIFHYREKGRDIYTPQLCDLPLVKEVIHIYPRSKCIKLELSSSYMYIYISEVVKN